MNEPQQIALFDKRTNHVERQVEYVPPDPQVIRAYAYGVCAELKDRNPAYADPEIVSGLAAFLDFIAQTTAKYLNQGHKEYLLKGYNKPERTSKGGSNGKEKTITKSAA
jgi:hypothetical protein